MLKALIVDDDPSFVEGLAGRVAAHGFEPIAARSLGDARTVIEAQPVAAALIDLELPDGSGLDLVAPLQTAPAADVAIVTANSTVESAVLSFRLGALDYLTKPVDAERLKSFLSQARRSAETRRRATALPRIPAPFRLQGQLLGNSAPMLVVRELIERAAPTDATVLVTGETGTGKELVAQALHALSRRADKPLVSLNCGALAPNLIESELFGHEKGSFTGADRRRIGGFERADGGTLFLDEIAEMPLEIQVKLLRVLESRTLNRVGGDQTISFDVRMIAATNRDPQQAVREGRLREDLFYRLMVVGIELPALRERGDDVLLLAQHFVEELSAHYGMTKHLSRAALPQLASYDWPGNVRELRNMIERAVVVGPDEIDFKLIPVALVPATGSAETTFVGSTIADVEHRLILATLSAFHGNKPKAARTLGISLKTLYNRINAYRDH
ncbi:MAG: sigma-54-dependent Fis family transcriptional regulator [Deltaproteobacteria bacterium]|nr:sigma-54-dependent Fis family transcriptional regulator [Deltaproteobacteria bacterium]